MIVSYNGLVRSITISLLCVIVILISQAGYCGSLKKIEATPLAEVLPLIVWAEETPQHAYMTTWVYSVIAMSVEDYAECRKVNRYCEHSEYMYIAPSEREEGKILALFKTPDACNWKFHRWVSVVVTPTPHGSSSVFEAIRDVGQTEIVRFAAGLNTAEVVETPTYPSLEGANQLSWHPITTYHDSMDYRVYEGSTHRIVVQWSQKGSATEFTFDDQLKSSRDIRGKYGLSLDGKWRFGEVVSEELTGENNTFSVIRLYKMEEGKNRWESEKKDILINPWEAHVKDGP